MQLKLPHFNGTASLESYLAQLELAAQLSGWTPEQTAGHLALALEGPALEAILDLPPTERQNLQALTAALQRRFIRHRSAEASREKLLSRYRCEEESWGKVAADVQRYAREAYPEFNAAAQEKLALHAFLRALTPERLRDHVSLAQPGSISEALVKTTRAEDTLAIRPTPQPTCQHVRVADGEEVRWTCTPLQRPAGRQGRCYRCDEPGHIAHNCPAPAPKPRKPPPSGNEAGTAQSTPQHRRAPTSRGVDAHHHTADISDRGKDGDEGEERGSSWFSSLDLHSGYWQVRLAPEAKPKTAFTIGQFWVMPFGLCNAPATFERLMERVLAAVPRSRCVVYLDDLLVHASDFQQALANLTDVLAAIRQAGLRLNPKKCQLLRRETAFLGHIVSERGVATDPFKVAAVRD
ncbi:hypothetical protein SKAU_G00243980 [Synaphobranchus kaupii]|uniref:ribonuclease H n=1 Tax=Synaphobranchus kaupii TaxID=118154 RepID=A0A9Q1IR04_SYNKA|nr:hypothetical protein SKAU_G00243980 [Synaphobranchus kaupii]